jgi:hypothetical protein
MFDASPPPPDDEPEIRTASVVDARPLRPQTEEVQVTHNESAQPETQRAAAKLTLNVRDVETDADVEMSQRGALRPKSTTRS